MGRLCDNTGLILSGEGPNGQSDPIKATRRNAASMKGNAMFEFITRPALAATLAASVALSPIAAAPARADNSADAIVATAFFGLVAAGILSSLAEGKQASPATHATPAAPETHHNTRWGNDNTTRWGNGNRWEGGNRNRVTARKLLPEQCKFTIHRGQDRGTYFDRRCLKLNFDNWGYLPSRCETSVTAPYRNRGRSYTEQCLSRFGYQVASRRR